MGRLCFIPTSTDSSFRAPSSLSSSPDRSNIVRSELLPLLAEIDKRTFGTDEYGCKALREQCFAWIDALLFELRVEQPANERGACLEGLGCVFERSVVAFGFPLVVTKA